MGKESVNKKLDKVRKPRVHISYDVQVGDAIENRQIPFVVGVMADLGGNSTEPLPALKGTSRTFVQIDKENFEDVLRGIKPHLEIKVPNTLSNDGSSLGIQLDFNSMADFNPERLAQHVEPIRKLVEQRQKLNELALKVNSSDKLDSLLEGVVKDKDRLKKLNDELATGTPKPEGTNS